MRALGIVRNSDPLGRFVLPAELRRSLDINPGDDIEIYTEGSSICLQKSEPKCIFCGGTHDVEVHLEKLICRECITHLSAL